MEDCKACALHVNRRCIVGGEGPLNAKVMFVGECPGPDEDKVGRPFIGRAGQLLRKVITSLGVEEDQVYITNLVKCFPFTSLNPAREHIDACCEHLVKEISTIKPRVVVSLGKNATEFFSAQEVKITHKSGTLVKWWVPKVKGYENITLLPVVHPSYVLRGNMKPKDYAMHFLPMLKYYYDV